MPWSAPTYTGGVVWQDLPSHVTPLNALDLNTEENAEATYAATVGQSVVNYFDAGVFFARNYGIKGDCRTVTDAAITSGSNVVISAELTSADAGKLAVFVGAGASGAHLYGWIGTAGTGTATLVTTQGGTTPLNAGTTVASGGEFVYATDDTTARDSCIAAAAAVGGTAVFPDAQMGVRTLMATSAAISIVGQGVKELYGGTDGGNTCTFPTIAPYLEGTVFVMMAANTDIVQLSGQGRSQNLKGIGLRFAGRYKNTGHGLNSTPAANYGNIGGGWEDVKVFGVDGNHYGILPVAPMMMRWTGLRSYGGGGLRLYNGVAPSQPGNITALDCYFATYIGGSAHAVHIDGSGAGGNLSACLFENVNAQVDLQSPAIPGTSQPTSAQQVVQTTNGASMVEMGFVNCAGQSQISGSNATYPSGLSCYRTNNPTNATLGNAYPPNGVVSGTGYQNQTGAEMAATFMFRMQPLAAGSPSTTLNGATAVGASSVIVTSATGFAVGQVIQIDTGANTDYAIITSISGTTLNLLTPGNWGLDFAHATGVTVQAGAAAVFGQLSQDNVAWVDRVVQVAEPIGVTAKTVQFSFFVPASYYFRLDFGNATRTWNFYQATLG